MKGELLLVCGIRSIQLIWNFIVMVQLVRLVLLVFHVMTDTLHLKQSKTKCYNRATLMHICMCVTQVDSTLSGLSPCLGHHGCMVHPWCICFCFLGGTQPNFSTLVHCTCGAPQNIYAKNRLAESFHFRWTSTQCSSQTRNTNPRISLTSLPVQQNLMFRSDCCSFDRRVIQKHWLMLQHNWFLSSKRGPTSSGLSLPHTAASVKDREPTIREPKCNWM